MAKDRLSDKLAVILHADVAGSTQMVQQDEHLAHERIQDSFRRFGDTIEKYRGTILELRGDALLAEFERASDAVSATLAFQTDQAYYLSRLKDDLKPSIRVGIAMGEIVMGDSTATGAGVVLAQRVEQLAEPGSLCITAAVHEALPNRMPFSFDNFGEQVLKGFDDPIRVYQVELSPGASIPPPQQESRSKPSRQSWQLKATIAVVVVAIAIGIAYVFKSITPLEEPASIERMAFLLPDKPSIAVLPFTNISDDPNQEYFADGMTEDLITDLSKLSGLFVIARNSSFSYKGQQVKVRQVAEELGVRYVMEGSVRRSGNQVRINAQLIDATTGGHLWAERYDGSLADIFSLQDQITRSIVSELSLTFGRQVDKSVEATVPEAYDEYLQGLSFYLRNTPKDNAKAEPHFKRALELDPDFKRSYSALAKIYYKAADKDHSQALGIYSRQATLLAHKNLARSVGANIAEAHVVRSWMASYKHQIEIALREADKALGISANDVEALKAKAIALVYSGQYEKGRNLANRVMRLDPAALDEPLYIIGLSYFAEGNYDKAAKYVERAIKNDPTIANYFRLSAAAYGKLGMEKEAKEALATYRKYWLWSYWIAAAVFDYPFEDEKVLKNLADGFKAAGLAERPPSFFLKFNSETRLKDHEIKNLLFGHTIKGQDYWLGTEWSQQRTIEGKVIHSGTSFYTGNLATEEGRSWVEDDRLCDRWSDEDGDSTICVTIFHDPDKGKGNYYMVNDIGPHLFQVSN